MLQEKNYDFRKRMLEVHKKNLRDMNMVLRENEVEIKNGFTIFVSEAAGDVMINAVKDFADYLLTSMNLFVMIKVGQYDGQENAIVVALSSETGAELGNAVGYRGYRIDTLSSVILVNGYDERGAAQALYSLEDIMSIRRAPYLPMGTVCRKPMYSPQMVHSGYGLDKYPDEYLMRIAHEGRDAILIFVTDVNTTPYGYLDFNELIHRAARYGIDVYAYSDMKSEKHPDEPDAEAFYEGTYGKLFRMCPGLKGVSLVGESVEFPSKDEHISGRHRHENVVDGIPTGKVSSGWYPCNDYPQWLNLIKKVIRKYNREADIIFWTYNWNFQPQEARMKLISELPTDITLMATFEMGESYELDDIREWVADYTISRVGYGEHYFKSEAEAAAKRGIRFYSMTNTGGLTWDFGVIPYEPFPYQWIKRYRAMQEAHEKWGLCGIMESHHFGFYPSFISKLSKVAFYEGCDHIEERLYEILQGEFGAENAEEVDKALKLWSEGITHYVPSDADQYGAFRVGPSYPLNLLHGKVCNLPSASYSMFGNKIVKPLYYGHNDGRSTATSIRVPLEKASLEKMRTLIEQGLAILEEIDNPNDNLSRLINMGKFINCSLITGIHAKEWYCLNCALSYERDRNKLAEILDDMEVLLKAEKKNVENTIPLVQADSRLGWEPSMEYMTDERHLRWKLRQLDYIMGPQLANNRKSIVL